ncbi:pantoate--beta-alanine ligase [Microbulbifer sp. ANSA003]|uniref:pantoate--beta-alanine ligase n=1 Tax=Microbulbifer sp. ANSA003 TaxID=3243360 RepID=UPI004042D84F
MHVRPVPSNFADLEKGTRKRIEESGFRVDYFFICYSKDLQPAADDDKEITILGAMYTSAARLIDNVSLEL